jgi:nitronate monooxygenase
MEAGGHRGSFQSDAAEAQMVGLFALLPQICDAVSVPVIAAGAIADGRGVAAALTLGASAVLVGAGFLRSPEAGLNPAYAEALAKTAAEQTTITRVYSGRAARGIRNRYIEASAAADAPPAPYPIQRGLTGPMREAALKASDAEKMQMWAGQAAQLAQSASAAIIVQQIWKDALQLL